MEVASGGIYRGRVSGEVNIHYYSLIHLQFLLASDAKLV